LNPICFFWLTYKKLVISVRLEGVVAHGIDGEHFPVLIWGQEKCEVFAS